MRTLPTAAECAVVELRQYTLKPGRRDDLIELFDREFIESQEAEGAHLLGQFRDLDREDPSTRNSDATVTATIAHVEPSATPDQRREVAAELSTANGDARWSARLETLHAQNTFPALPVREDANVVVLLSNGQPGRRSALAPAVLSIEQLRLSPTARSRLP
jgi:hypothetical protein